MPDALDHFPPSRQAALERLARFVPLAGRAYAARRNDDLGPGRHAAVSTLSPYLRTRLITETEVLQAVLARHSRAAAEKFAMEVYWRTYWKGWLESRPSVWDQYRHGAIRALDAVQSQSGLRAQWEAACTGRTGIGCFDAWALELAQTGYLHNHARMWFASIWIFTLRLPWELGADFFLRHLLDGDPAANTLGWRWVAGLQTPGKTYLARRDNIRRHTNGRFDPEGLAASAPALSGPPPPAPLPLPALQPPDPARRTGLLLHPEDLSPGFVFDAGIVPVTTLFADTASGLSPLIPAPHVAAFRAGACADAAARWSGRLGAEAGRAGSIAGILDWARDNGLEQIVTPYAPVGPVASLLADLARHPGAPPVLRLRRARDSAAWPLATKGFFAFRKHIPDLLDAEGLTA